MISARPTLLAIFEEEPLRMEADHEIFRQLRGDKSEYRMNIISAVKKYSETDATNHRFSLKNPHCVSYFIEYVYAETSAVLREEFAKEKGKFKNSFLTIRRDRIE